MSMYRKELYSNIFSRGYNVITMFATVGIAIILGSVVVGYFFNRKRNGRTNPDYEPAPRPDINDRAAARQYIMAEVSD